MNDEPNQPDAGRRIKIRAIRRAAATLNSGNVESRLPQMQALIGEILASAAKGREAAAGSNRMERGGKTR